MGRAEDAKESLMEVLTIDYKNVDVFEQLIGGEMMKIDEGLHFSSTHSYPPLLPLINILISLLVPQTKAPH